MKKIDYKKIIEFIKNNDKIVKIVCITILILILLCVIVIVYKKEEEKYEYTRDNICNINFNFNGKFYTYKKDWKKNQYSINDRSNNFIRFML